MKKLPNFKPGRPHNARKHKRVLTKKHLGAGWQKQQIAARKKAEADHRLAQMNVHNTVSPSRMLMTQQTHRDVLYSLQHETPSKSLNDDAVKEILRLQDENERLTRAIKGAAEIADSFGDRHEEYEIEPFASRGCNPRPRCCRADIGEYRRTSASVRGWREGGPAGQASGSSHALLVRPQRHDPPAWRNRNAMLVDGRVAGLRG
jgi:hypothetical protein